MISVLFKSLFMSLIIVLPGLTSNTYHSIPVKASQFPIEKSIKSVPKLTLENVYQEIILKNIKFPNIVMRQVVWETKWLNCTNCSLNSNNLFGFTSKNGLMTFKTWVDCIDYYKKWQTDRHVEKYDNYYTFLVDSHYALGESYNNALRTLDISAITEKFQTTTPDWLRRL